MPFRVPQIKLTLTTRGVLLLVGSIAIAILTVYVGTRPHPNTLATALLQAITIVFSTYGAYMLAKASIEDAARELVSRQARPAFRRVRSIYEALGRLLELIDTQSVEFRMRRNSDGQDTVDYESVRLTMLMLERMYNGASPQPDEACVCGLRFAK
jgi:hypothetical protein